MVKSCAEKTYAGTTISDIVARASISRTTFYKHFTGKRACFDAAVYACVEEIRSVAREAHTSADPPADAVPKATAAILERMAAKPNLAQLLSGDAVAVEPAVVDRYRRLLIPAVSGLWDAAGEPRRPQMDPGLAFGRAQLLVFNQIAAGRSAQLPDLLPELVYLAVAPFAGHDEALKQVGLAERRLRPEPAPAGE
ncbi:MAG: helix-turn-helix transcriptional regulator [Thermoleophilia bacterium]|nr:helix-turn-helix transcriptional regulator [Thermoleophilia bacterium]